MPQIRTKAEPSSASSSSGPTRASTAGPTTPAYGATASGSTRWRRQSSPPCSRTNSGQIPSRPAARCRRGSGTLWRSTPPLQAEMILLLEAPPPRLPHRPRSSPPEGSTSYGELLDDARRVAAALRQRGITRFAIVEPDAAWVIRLLAGAALAGAEPCQYQPDTDAQSSRDQARALGTFGCREQRGPISAARSKSSGPMSCAGSGPPRSKKRAECPSRS